MRVSEESLGAFLLESAALSRRALEEARGLAEARGGTLREQLVAGGYLSRDELRRAEAHLLGVPFVELDSAELSDDALFLIPEPLARRMGAVAYARKDGEVEVALLDLAELPHLDFLRTEQGLKVLPRLTTGESVKRALVRYQRKLKERFSSLARGGAHAAESLLRHAFLNHASHIHLDLHTMGLLVRYRIRGLLHEAMTLPKEAAELMMRLKDMAGLSPTLHVPQEGGFKVSFEGGEEARVRVHAAPAHKGERLVLHLFATAGARKGFTLESAGLHGEALEEAYRLVHAPKGVVVVEGPQGSGKTTLLYTLLDLAAAAHRHLVTVEDEVEVALPHATQLGARPAVGLHTAATLRAALKQDPDVVMVAHAREPEVTELALSAAARGVLMFVGAESPGLFAAEHPLVKGVIKTRVVGRVCPHCKEAYKLSRAESVPLEAAGARLSKVLEALKAEGTVAEDAQWKDVTFARAGTGCKSCEAGYKGQVGIQEVGVGGQTPLNLIEDGLFKAAAGLTSVEEVVRLAGEV